MSAENLERIEPIDELETVNKPAEEIQPADRQPANREQFNSLMQENKASLSQEAKTTTNPTSLMDAVRDLNYNPPKGGAVSHDKLIVQTKEAIARIDEIKHALESPNVGIKTSAQQLLQNKLNHINESLKIALSRAGVEFNPTANPTHAAPVNPIERFLGFLTDGQRQLENLGSELTFMGKRGQELTPVNMLAVQVKVGQIQQELELFSSLLNKALESIKTIMNIQV